MGFLVGVVLLGGIIAAGVWWAQRSKEADERHRQEMRDLVMGRGPKVSQDTENDDALPPVSIPQKGGVGISAKGRLILICAIPIVVAALVVTLGNSGHLTRSYGEFDALALCKSTIKLAARDPDKADIPSIRGSRGGDSYFFEWGHVSQHLRLRNGLGLEVAATAMCIVDAQTQSITHLMLDGKTLIHR